MSYIGDFALGKTFDTKFCTVNTSGAPTTLAGSPVISAYVDNSLTQITAGITLTVDFDGVTGLHNIRVVATSGNGYATASNYQLVITTGTVGGTSVVGYVVAEFSIEARSALRPATADRALVVDAAGLADANTVKVGPSGSGTAQTAGDIIGDTNDIQARLPAALGANGNMKADVRDYNGTAGTFAGGRPEVNVSHWNDTAVPAEHTAGYPIVTIKDGTGTGEIDTASGRVAITEAQIDQIVDEVLDEDMTAHQTQGTLGQVIGDSGADADSIWSLANTNLDATVSSRLAGSTTGSGFTAIPWNAAWDAEVQSEVQDAIEVNQLDHLIQVADPGGVVANNSFLAKLASKSATAAFSSYDNTTDSLEAARDNIGTTGGALVLAKTTNITGFNDISTAQVNAEVLDVLSVDTFAEPSGAPAATATLEKKLAFLYEALRNKITITSTSKAFFNDAGTSQWSKALSDDGTTYTEAEGA